MLFVIIYWSLIGLGVILAVYLFVRKCWLSGRPKEDKEKKKESPKPAKKSAKKRVFWPAVGKVVFWPFRISWAFLKVVFPNYMIWPIIFTILGIFVFVYWDGLKDFHRSLKGVPDPPAVQSICTQVNLDTRIPRWTMYKLYVSAGSRVTFKANGQFYWDRKVCKKPTGPEGAWPAKKVARPHHFVLVNAPIASLMGKIGEDGMVFPIGKGTTYHVEEGGYLYLAINERWVRPGGGDYRDNWKDNSGLIHVRISIS